MNESIPEKSRRLSERAWRGFAAVAFLLLLGADGTEPARAAEKADVQGATASEAKMLSLLDAPLLFVKRHSYQGIHIYDAFYKWPPGGGGIYVLENPSAPRSQWSIRPVIDATTPGTLGNGVYTHPEISWDGKRLLFCYKNEPEGCTKIYEIGIDGKGLRMVSDPSGLVSHNKGRAKGMHDLAPSYLPNGRIVFLSTRPAGLVPCNNTGVAILHVMEADGSDIHAISVNSENEFDPSVLPDGRVLFGRWEYVDKNALTMQALWSTHPDGSEETAVFANNMVLPEAILDARAVPDSGLIAVTLAKHNAPPRGSIAFIDPKKGKNGQAALFNFEHHDQPDFDRGNSCEPYPLDRDTVIFSGRSKGERNAIEMMDRDGNRMVLLSEPDICLHSPMLVKARPLPRVIPEFVDRSKKTGAFLVMDVYEGLEGIERGEAKWLRVVEETSRISASPGTKNPFNQTFLVSASLSFSTKIFHGLTPVNEDGSVYFNAPSGRALYFQVLDNDKRLIQSMRTFIQAAPGTTRSCIGCHERKSNVSTPTYAMPKVPDGGPRDLVAESWGTGYMDYPSMIQPIWDEHCVSCHGGEKGFAARLDLSGGWTKHFNISYENLVDRRESQLTAHWIAGIDTMNGTAYWSAPLKPPRSHGSGVAPLADVIMSGHEGMIEGLDEKERDLIMAWIDSNGLYSGTWHYTEHGYGLPDWDGLRAELASTMAGAGCAECHDKTVGSDWFNLQSPELSRILRAPMKAGGDGPGLAICRNHSMDPRRQRTRLLVQGYAHAVKPLSEFAPSPMPPIKEGGQPHVSFASTDNPHYKAMLAIIRRGRKLVLATPRIDMPGAEPIVGECRMFIPPELPTQTPQMRASLDEYGRVHLQWNHSADTIGLSMAIHRSAKKDFTPNTDTLLTNTLLSDYVDDSAPVGEQHYALILKSLQQSSRPIRVSLIVPRPAMPPPPGNLSAIAVPGRVELQWSDDSPISLRYHVYRGTPGADQFERLTSEPTAALQYRDDSAKLGIEYTYAVRAVSRRGIQSSLSGTAQAGALPEITEALFVAAFTNDADADLHSGNVVHGTLHARSRIATQSLDLSEGGHTTFAHQQTFDLDHSLSVECWVNLNADGQMPVVVSCGRWNDAGWFLQRIGSGWRWHVGGINCDGGHPAVGRWTHMLGTFDGQTTRLYQDGTLVAEKSGDASRRKWPGPLTIGQYSNPGSQYQVHGKIANLRIFNCTVSAEDAAASFQSGLAGP
ncbi:MAG: hypothetical protein GY903_22245 [Fuerstiella sp.]|nr:hypothetical protein [Fuerstiella sp.]MCP4857214.1 hypothetical protein [Fuerstiella sp.]